MCGIVGIWDFQNKIEKNVLEKMRNTLSHRGPDDVGLFIDQNNNIGFGHQRLSILDLSELGHQPMIDNNLVIVFNGEIYNFEEIKKELENRGYKFKSDSDTEVILKSYQEWGKKAVDKFRGMFAFAIFDKEKEKIILCRDRAGVKPLYYHFNNKLFIFASEIKAIVCHPRVKREINFNALSLFLQSGYISEPHSIFKDIYKLEPGYFLEIDKKKNIKKEKYWDVIDFYLKIREAKEEEQVIEELEKILIDSFKLRLVSDVPVGIFLSGGIDSSLVAALLAKNTNYPLKTFTIGFKEKEYDESQYARKVAHYLGTEHHEMVCTQKEALDIIPKLAEIYDEPFGDDSAIPTFLLSEFTKRHLKVSLSADGGDEIFCGYTRYQRVNRIFQTLNKIPLPILSLSKKTINSLTPEKISDIFSLIKKTPNLQNRIKKIENTLDKKNNLEETFRIINNYWLKDEINDLVIPDFSFPDTFFNDFKRTKNLEPMTQMQAIDFKTYLPSDILTKVDRATMANGLEGRDPLLDHKIIEYVAGLPLSFKYQNKDNKYILKKILYKYLPKELFQRPKMGFAVPTKLWFRDKLTVLLKEYLDPKKIEREKIFNKKVVEKELNLYFLGKTPNITRLWFLLMFQMWKEKWLS